MSTRERDTRADPNAEPLADYGKAAIMIPLIIGGAVVVSVIILWHTYAQKLRMIEMSRIEVAARQEVRGAYRALRALDPDAALTRAERAGAMLDSLKTGMDPDYARLRIALLMLEGEALFMKDGAGNADEAEARFESALGLMPYASGERWELGMLGRARTRFALKRHADALSDLDSVLDRNPSFGSAYYWRSLTRMALGDGAGARADERRARALDSWPPLRDFMPGPGAVVRDILAKRHETGGSDADPPPVDE
jgi:hypothetical protein